MKKSGIQPLIQPGRYRHYRGNYYWVHGIVRHSETQELLVLYGTDEPQWVRPLKEFQERVQFDGRNVARFQLLPDIVAIR